MPKQTVLLGRKLDRMFDMSEPGTGKTIAHITCFDEWHKKHKKAALVFAPKSILQSAWGNDIEKAAPHLRYSVATAENREEAFAADADIYITNIDAANWLAKQNPNFFKKFGYLIIDECFPAGTLVDTPNGPMPIEVLKPGDLVYTSSGILPVTRTVSRLSTRLVRL